MLERRSSTSRTSTSTTSTSTSTSFSSSSSSTTTSTSLTTSTSTFSTTTQVLTATVDPLPAPHPKAGSPPASDALSYPAHGNGPAPKSSDGPDPPKGPATKPPQNPPEGPIPKPGKDLHTTELPKGPATKPGNEYYTTELPNGPDPKPGKEPQGPGTKPGEKPNTTTDKANVPWGGQPDRPEITSPTTTTTTPSTTYTNEQITITSAPNWGDQKIPVNECNFIAPGGNIEWNPCMVFAGTVQLRFFPEAKGNLSYPATYFDESGLTMISPSVYMIINTLTASNACGPLGPTYTDYTLSMDLTDVSTLQPFPDATARYRIGDSKQLDLADLATDCPKFSDRPPDQTLILSDGGIVDTHPIANDWNRCNPRLVMPSAMKSVGLPYWRHCGNDNGRFGIFDPPGAVPPVNGLFPTTQPAPVVPTPTPANPLPTVQPAPSPTNAPQPPASDPPVQDPPATTTTVAAPNPPPDSPPASYQPVPNTPPNVPDSPAPTVPAPAAPQTDGGGYTALPAPAPQEPSVVAVIGTNTISAVAGSAGVVLPNGAPATVGAVATYLDASNKPVVVSVAPSGIVIQGSGSTKQIIPNPTPAPGYSVGAPVPIATVGSHVIFAEPGATTVVIPIKQTLSAGGPPITIDGTHAVATLGAAGLIIQYPSGKVSTFVLPTGLSPAPTVAGNVPAITPTVSELNGLPLSPLKWGLGVVIGTQTVSIGGPAITIPIDTIVTQAPPGLLITQPDGVVSTLALGAIVMPAPTYTEAAEDGIGGIIASMGGYQGAPIPSATSLSTITSESASDQGGIASIIASGIFIRLPPKHTLCYMKSN